MFWWSSFGSNDPFSNFSLKFMHFSNLGCSHVTQSLNALSCIHFSNCVLKSNWTSYLAMQYHTSRQFEISNQIKRRSHSNLRPFDSSRLLSTCTSDSSYLTKGLQILPLHVALFSGIHFSSKSIKNQTNFNTFASLSNSHKHSIEPDGKKKKITITSVLLAINAVAFLLSNFSDGRILALGVKVNALIDRGQFWRLLSPALLHANITHILINSLSLNSVGPSVEALSGKKRFLSIYIIAAISGNFFSYKFNPHISLGSSAAVFGLVGSLAVFLIRHRHLLGENWGKELKSVGFTILLNLGMGLVYRDIDNWGHLGGLFGGALASWLLGPSLFVGPNEKLVDFAPMHRFLLLLKRGFKKQ